MLIFFFSGMVMTFYHGRQLSQSALTMELPDLPRSKPGVLTVCQFIFKVLIIGLQSAMGLQGQMVTPIGWSAPILYGLTHQSLLVSRAVAKVWWSPLIQQSSVSVVWPLDFVMTIWLWSLRYIHDIVSGNPHRSSDKTFKKMLKILISKERFSLW